MNLHIRQMAREEFWSMADRAKERGLDLAEVLDREGVLLTHERYDLIVSKAWDHIAEMLETTAPGDWLPDRSTRAQATLYDLQHGIVQVLKQMAEKKRRI